MKTMIIAAVAVSALAGVAQAAGSVSDLQLLQVARCRGLASSEGLGKLDTTAIDKFLKAESQSRDLWVQTSAANRISSAQAQGDKAQGAKKEKLLVERQEACATWLQGAP